MRSTLQKFDGRAQDYVVGRPVYAQEFVEALFRDYGFSSDSVKGSGRTFRICAVLPGKRNRSRNHSGRSFR